MITGLGVMTGTGFGVDMITGLGVDMITGLGVMIGVGLGVDMITGLGVDMMAGFGVDVITGLGVAVKVGLVDCDCGIGVQALPIVGTGVVVDGMDRVTLGEALGVGNTWPCTPRFLGGATVGAGVTLFSVNGALYVSGNVRVGDALGAALGAGVTLFSVKGAL